MKVTKVCELDGRSYTMDIPSLTPELLAKGEQMRRQGVLIQTAFRFLNADELEFLLTGTPPDVWDELFGQDDGK